MLRRLLNSILALGLALTPAAAQEFNIFLPYNKFAAAAAVVLYTATCNASTSNATTYAHNTITVTGLADATAVNIAVGFIGEDTSGSFGVNSSTVDTVAMTERADNAGAETISAAFYSTSTTQTNAASVDVSVTYSEAITSSVACVWALENLNSATPTATVADSEASNGVALVLTLSSTTAGGYGLGVSGTASADGSAAWAALTERQDTQHAEADYSNADAVTTGSSMSATCTWTTAKPSSGAAVAFR